MLLCAMIGMTATTIQAQVNAADSVMQHVKGNRLSVGGYGEVGYTREFFSDHVNRYASPANYKDDPSHGKFDIPHAVIYLSYDFGKGWTMGTEIEFEHTGTGSAIENEADEAAEWEYEQEKGGEVELEQFWINKEFSKAANVRFGHIIVPVGLNNAHHEPLHYFTVYRPEGENTILPSTWHDTGLSFWGRAGQFKYQVMVVAGLNAMLFNRWQVSPKEYPQNLTRMFKKEFGTILCPEIHKQLFGRTFDFTDPKELEMYMNMEGRCEKCAQTVARAVRITCEMLMEDED